MKSYALITGASGGIGQEFVYEYARHHFNLVLVARNEEKLNALKLELEKTWHIRVLVIAEDLSDEDAALRIYDRVRAEGIHVIELINNAGAGKQVSVTDADTDTLKNLIHLNVTSVTLLCRLFGHDMVKAGKGRILNVSSMGAFIPDPYFNVYGPTKAFELFLTEAMYGELKGTGVTVSALCPGPVKTNWARNAGKADSKMAKDPADIARSGFRGLHRGDLIIIPSADNRIERSLMKGLPAKAQVRIIRAWQKYLIDRASA